MTAQKWRWFGHAAHFICGHRCRFHLATQVGPWLVSTVGEMPPHNALPDANDGKWYEIGLGRTYETMVFRAGAPCKRKGCACGLPEIDGSEQDFAGYNDAGAATVGHLKLCRKWAKIRLRGGHL